MSPDDEMNAKLVKFLPELASSYGKYPLQYNRWLSPGERGPNGEPCFIRVPKDGGVKNNYVWGKGPNGQGYYHLLTKAAYDNLYVNIINMPPSSCCCVCSAAARKEMDEWEDVKKLIYSRSVSPSPDDGVARQAVTAAAKDVARAHHRGIQNEKVLYTRMTRLTTM